MICKDTIHHQWDWEQWDFHLQDRRKATVVPQPTQLLLQRNQQLLMPTVPRPILEILATRVQMRTDTQWTTPWWAILACFLLWVWPSTGRQISPTTRKIPTKSKIKLKSFLFSVRGRETSETSTSWKKKGRESSRRRWALAPIVRVSFVRFAPSKEQAVRCNLPTKEKVWSTQMTKTLKIKPKSTFLISKIRLCSRGRL